MRYKNIIFDFDGVLFETNEIRFEGFQELFKDYAKPQVRELIDYAHQNGGASRYVKIEHFFKNILRRKAAAGEIQALADKYSELVKHKIIAAASVKGSLEFLASYKDRFNFAVVSGSDQRELNDVCSSLGIAYFFIEILGSPLSKEENLARLLSRTGWSGQDCLYVGDSINDLNAANANNMDFIARNSNTTDWRLIKNIRVIDDLTQLPAYIGSSS